MRTTSILSQFFCRYLNPPPPYKAGGFFFLEFSACFCDIYSLIIITVVVIVVVIIFIRFFFFWGRLTFPLFSILMSQGKGSVMWRRAGLHFDGCLLYFCKVKRYKKTIIDVKRYKKQ